jgi:hypothetical protein
MYAISVFGFFCITLTTAYGAVQYTPLVEVPGLGGSSGIGLAAYLNRIYVVLIALGAIIAFLKIAFAGVKYSLDEVVTHKAEAKSDIQGALIGLAILLIPFIVLNTIYPGLTSLNILGSAANNPDVGTNLNTSGGAGVRGTGSDGSGTQTLQDICTVRNGVVPPAGCVTGSMTEVEAEIARLCARGGGTYNIPTRTCVPPAGTCINFPQTQLTSARYKALKEGCSLPSRIVEEATDSTQSVIRVCCVTNTGGASGEF